MTDNDADDARHVILTRVRRALGDVPSGPAQADTPVPWAYHRPTPMAHVLDRFVERVVDYGAVVVRADATGVADEVAGGLRAAGAASVVLPVGLPTVWRDAVAAAGLQVRTDEAPLSRAELDQTDAVVTAAAVGIAETGTIALDHGPDQGRRALSLVPDVHVCVVRADQVVSDVPEAVGRLGDAARAGRPITWISGPSATSDIELSRVEGVHGPRRLHVVLVTGALVTDTPEGAAESG